MRRSQSLFSLFRGCLYGGSLAAYLILFATSAFAATAEHFAAYPGQPVPRAHDEIVVAGQFFHTGTRVVLWMDPHGYDAYRQAKWFTRRADVMDPTATQPSNDAVENSPNHYGVRDADHWTPAELYQLRRGRWTLKQLQSIITQLVLHYDACGTSYRCFQVLQQRGLSVHFMIDLDGTVYQTLDLKERGWTSGIANDHAINIEIANIGAYPLDQADKLGQWYHHEKDGRTIITIPTTGPIDFGHELQSDVPLRPVRPKPITGEINGKALVQYDYTKAQYRALIKLTAALHRIFPKIKITYPRNKKGGVLTAHPLTPDQLAKYHGILGHQHITNEKDDPGPAFRWKWYVSQVKKLLDTTAKAAENGGK